MSDNHWTDPRDAEIVRLETICAEMEAEIEAACSLICLACRLKQPVTRVQDRFILPRNVVVMTWTHGFDGCQAAGIHEAKYQRQLKGSK